MHVVVWSVSLTIAWQILQLLRCVPAVIGADQPPATVNYSTRAPELQTPNNRIPDQPDSHPVRPIAGEGSTNVAATDYVYPVLTTGSPLSIAQTEYGTGDRQYYLYADGGGTHYRREADIRRPEYSTNHGSNVDPRWNRYERVLLLFREFVRFRMSVGIT